jgi:hypothetical protein
MAARKSCTKLTWAEAKARVGESSSTGSKKKPNGLVGTKNHATHQAQKIISKNDNRSETDRIKDRQAARLARKDAERQEHLDAQREAAKEQARLEQLVRPYDLAIEWLATVATDHRDKGEPSLLLSSISTLTTKDGDGLRDLDQVCECRQMQLDEILALEAIYDGAEMEPLSFVTKCRLDDHRKTMDEWQMDPDNEELKKAVRDLPPISFTLKIVLENVVASDSPTEDPELVSLMLLQVTFPPLYPLYACQTPEFDVVDFMVVDKTMVCNRNKPLESLGYLRQEDFIAELKRQALELHGMPCVYEIVSTWLQEEAPMFSSFITMNPIISLTSQT